MAGIGLLMPQTDLLQLDRRMVDSETAANDVAELFQNLMTVIVAANNSVTAHGMDSGGQRPDMQIVDRRHTFDAVQRAANRFQIDVRWCSFQQDVHGILHQSPGVVQNQQANHETDQRISHVPSLGQHQDSSHNRPGGPQCISDHMQKRTADVQVA